MSRRLQTTSRKLQAKVRLHFLRTLVVFVACTQAPAGETPDQNPGNGRIDAGSGCTKNQDCFDAAQPQCNVTSGKCEATSCSADAQCGALVCRNGQCTAPPDASSVARCEISPSPLLIKKGEQRRVSVTAFDSTGRTVLIPSGPSWNVVANAPVSISGLGQAATVTGIAVAVDATDAVTATFGTRVCSAKAIVLSDTLAAGRVGVVVVDEATKRPVSKAVVLVSDSSGAVVAQPSNESVATDSRGYAEVFVGPLTTVTLSVFSSDFDYVTAVNVATNASPIFAFSVRRNNFATSGGIQGTYANAPATSAARLGIAGLSLTSSVVDISASQLLGASVPTDIRIPPLVNQKAVPVPQGVYIAFGSEAIKTQFSARGSAGVCRLSSGEIDEARTDLGACGSSAVWAFGGDVPTRELPLGLLLGGGQNAKPGEFLSAFIPLFKRFSSSLLRTVEYDMKPLASLPTANDTTHFAKADLPFAQQALSFAFAVKSPLLPEQQLAPASSVLLLGGAQTAMHGFVPLAIGAGVNSAQPLDRLVDKADDLSAAGLIGLRMAPPHHGLEGAPLRLLLSAFGGSTVGPQGTFSASMVAGLAQNVLPNDPTGLTPVDLSARPFLNVPRARYNFLDTVNNTLNGRELSVADGAGPQSVLRAQFVDSAGRRWVVLASGAETSVRIPKPPAPFEDRTFAAGLVPGERSSFSVQSLQLKESDTEVSPRIEFQRLMALNAFNLDDLSQWLSDASQVTYWRPRIEFATPAVNGVTVAKKSKIQLAVTGASVGMSVNDSTLKLSFFDANGESALCPPVVLTQESTPGAQTFELTLADGCVGAGLRLEAALFEPGGIVRVSPPVSSALIVTVE
jgi:hypothetical protein